MLTLTSIQDAYIDTVTSAKNRWSHRKDGGHSGRMIRAARRKARAALVSIGFDEAAIQQAIKDADDMVALELAAA